MSEEELQNVQSLLPAERKPLYFKDKTLNEKTVTYSSPVLSKKMWRYNKVPQKNLSGADGTKNAIILMNKVVIFEYHAKQSVFTDLFYKCKHLFT